MKKIFAWLAVVPLTIATESMIYPVWAECQPDRYGNIIDLGDGNCGQKIELQPPDTLCPCRDEQHRLLVPTGA